MTARLTASATAGHVGRTARRGGGSVGRGGAREAGGPRVGATVKVAPPGTDDDREGLAGPAVRWAPGRGACNASAAGVVVGLGRRWFTQFPAQPWFWSRTEACMQQEAD